MCIAFFYYYYYFYYHYYSSRIRLIAYLDMDALPLPAATNSFLFAVVYELSVVLFFYILPSAPYV